MSEPVLQQTVVRRRATVQEYIDSPELLRKLKRRTLMIVVLSQIFGGAGLAAGVTVGALLAQDMLGTDSYAGVPTALFTLGSALAAFLVGRLSQRLGRRVGLTTGFMAGCIGAIGIVMAAVIDNLPLLFVSLLVYGAGTATNLLARYTGADLAKPTERARDISLIMVSTTFGAVAGPNLVDTMGNFATSIDVPALAGPFILAAAGYLIAGLVLFAWLRPDPFTVALAISEAHKKNGTVNREQGSEARTPDNRGVIVGTTVMVLTQIVMVAIMTMTPVHMKHHGHSLADVGLVISIHISAMFLPSLITGMLVDKIGRTAMAYAAGVTLLAAGVVAASVPADSMPLLIVALTLLGLGWNFGLISGTAQIVDATTVATRAKTQGAIDVLVAISGATGGVMSGVVVSHSSYSALSLSGSLLSLLLIPVVLWTRRRSK